MRRLLDRLYDSAAALAALFLIGVLISVLLSIITRLLHFHIAGLDAYAGYCMAAAGFLALAHTLKRGDHIRVTLLLQSAKGKLHKGLEIWALGAASVLACALAFYSTKLAWQSHKFNDISTGNDATPLWIPQIAMALGCLILAIAFIDELVLEVAGKRSKPASSEAAHNE
jgi:TRAP-type C4-dicarboxylate transport system permease small subunit